jgi:hypothetical protein
MGRVEASHSSDCLVFIGIAHVACAGNATAGRDPRLPACDRGQFAATVRAARGEPTAVARWFAPFTDRIALAWELAGPRAAEVTLTLKVIDERWGVTLKSEW